MVCTSTGLSGTSAPAYSRVEAAGVVPVDDRPGLPVVAEHAHRRGRQLEPDALGRSQSDPAGTDDPAHVAVTEGKDAPGRPVGERDHRVGSSSDVLGGLAAEGPVPPDRPAW